MTKQQLTESLRQARKACLFLQEIVNSGALTPPTATAFSHLILQFERLDAKEEKQRAAGRTHGSKGGRPRKR